MTLSPISRIRRFNRAVTTETGALDHSFLGRGRPLGAARVLNAIGPNGRDLADIRDFLQLDTGLLSRLLRALEDEYLITTGRHPTDGRRRVARLTPAGHTETACYDTLSDERAQNLLDQHPHPDALLAAMDLVASALGRHRFDINHSNPRSETARYCLSEYTRELAHRFDAGFDITQNRDPDATDMEPPRGVFLVAMSDGLPIGCAGLKGDGTALGEVKRVWVAPAARGLGLARALMIHTENTARTLGMTHLRLDTNSALTGAIAMYRKSGWIEIPRFNNNPYAHLWFEKPL